MADNTQKLDLDASGLVSALAQAEAAFKAHNAAVNSTASVYLSATEKSKGIEVSFKSISAEGVRLQGVLREVNGAWEAQVTSVTKVDDALKRLKASQLATGAQNAQQFLSQQNVPNAVPPDFQNQLRLAQQNLAKALAGDANGGLKIAQEIFAKLQQGIVDVEVGIRGKIQAALIAVLTVQRQITAEQDKQAKASAPAPGVDPTKLALLKSQIAQAFAIPTGASLNSILQFQNALSGLINVAAKGKVDLAEVARILNGVNATPGKDFAGANVELQKVQTAAQRVVQAFGAMGSSAQQAGQQGQQAARSLFVSFDQFLKIIEIQVIHRVFGNLITGMQNSIGAAADLQIKISEIRTISQQSGISFTQFQDRIRALSEEFGKPQIDVARAAYQGFSNQVIKTSADMSILNEALRLSRIAVIEAEAAMNLLSSVMVSYGFNASEASAVTARLFKAIEIGRFTGRDVADTLGRITVTASQVGITDSEVLGLFARLTRAGVSPAEALTQVSAVMTALQRPSQELSTRFRQLGFDSGLSAVQTLGFVGTLRLLQQEAERSNGAVAGLFTNVRAQRGFRGAIQGGPGGLEEDINQIANAGPSADRAFSIVAESAGDAFRKELIKIQNFFTNDFANGFLEAIRKIGEPFGGISNIVKDFGKAVIDIVSVLLQFAKVGLDVLAFTSGFGLNIGSLIKIFIAYKAAVIALSVAQSIVAGTTAVYNAAVLSLAAKQTAATLATTANTTATGANATATGTAAIAATGFGTITVANTAAVATFTKIQIAGAVASRILTAAMLAIPIVAVVAALALFLGAFDAFTNKLKQTEQAIEALGSIQANLNRAIETERREADRRDQQATREFNQNLEDRSRAINGVLTQLSRMANAAVEVQRNVVRETTEQLKQASDAVRSEMSTIISDLNREITEASTAIRQSLKREREFADREQSSLFKRRFDAAGRQPEIVRNLRPLSFQDQQFQQIERQGQANSFQQQRLLLEQRIAELTRQANEDIARGDRASVESARRKFEEIRRLTEQQFGLETDRGRQQALDAATDAARQSGTMVQAIYQVNLQRLQQQLDAITAQERAAEEAFRARQAEQEATARRELAERLVQQRALQRALQELNSFTPVNDQGELRREFQGPGGQERARAEFERRAAAARAAAEAAGIGGDAIINLESAIANQRRALAQQVERQITADTINEIRRRFQLAREEVSRLQQEAQGASREAAEVIRQSITQIPTLLQSVLQNVQNNSISGAEEVRQRVAANAAELVGAGNAPALAAEHANTVRVRALQTQLLAQQEQAARALTAFNDARARARDNPNDPGAVAAETEALATLRARVAEVTETYRQFLRLRFGDNQIPGGTRTGNQEAALSNDLNTSVQNIQVSMQRITEANTRIAEAEARVRTLREQYQLITPELRGAAEALNQAGQAAANQTLNFNNLATAINGIAGAVERLNRAGPLPALPQVGAPAAPAPEGFATGGMIGNAFSAKGADDTLIWAKRGEFVVNPDSTRRFYSQLVALNAGKMPRHYAEGGVVTTTNVGDVTIHVDGSKSPETTARAVLAHMKREFRKGNG